MNHPDLYFSSHTPESTAQNKAMGKKLCSSFTSLAPVAPSNSAQHRKLQRHPSRNPQSEQWKSGHGNTRKWKERARRKKINYQHETHLHLMEKTMKLWPAPSSRRDWGQRRDRPRTRLRDQSGLCFHAALLPTWAWGWAAAEGRRLGKFHGHSSDFSMKQKYSNLAWKVKAIPKENIHTVLLWDYAASIYS